MRHGLTIPALLLALTGCAPLAIYHQPGISVSKMQSDTLDCEVRALRDAPVANQIRRTGPVFVPPRQLCNAAGDCTVYGGYWDPGEIYTVDVNEGLRARVEAQCMAARGYRPVQLPVCPQGVANATPPARTTTLPRLAPNSCVIRNRDRSWQIVTPG